MLVALGLYVGITLILAVVADPLLFSRHTNHNHYALLAEGWREGRLSLAGEPPSYTGGNDFALYRGRWFVAFPPFPALCLVPALWFAEGGAESVRDGLCFLMLAGITPAVLFLVFEKLRRMGESQVDTLGHALWSLLFACGSVYFFCAVQGTVWYAAHVVGAALLATYVLLSLGAEKPLAAGVVLGLGFLTRTPLLFAAPFFYLEAWRVYRASNSVVAGRGAPSAAPNVSRRAVFLRSVLWFTLPLACCLSIALVLNQLRFDDPWDFGYRHLEIRWRDRIERWGLFHYHYLAKNLGVVLTGLPWFQKLGSPTPFQINAHGLALWITTPLYLWLFWPRRRSALAPALGVSLALVALPTLFYQNTGWVQFGYRFSNDYAVLLFVLLVVAGQRLEGMARLAAGFGIVVNTFGALTFNRPEYREYYYVEPTQEVLYQPD